MSILNKHANVLVVLFCVRTCYTWYPASMLNNYILYFDVRTVVYADKARAVSLGTEPFGSEARYVEILLS